MKSPGIFSSIYIHLFRLLLTLLLIMLPGASEAAIKSKSKILPFPEESPEALFKIASDYQKKENLDSALICYSWLTEIYKESKDRPTRHLVGKSLSEMGQLYYIRFNDYSSAYRYLAEAQEIFADMSDRDEYAEVLLNLGNIFNMYDYIFPRDDNRSMQRSRDFYQKSFQLGVESGNWNMVCSSYINLMMLDVPFKVDRKLNSRMQTLLRDSLPKSTEDYQLSNLLCIGSEAIASGNYAEARNAAITIRDSIGLTAPREKYMATVCLSAVAVAEKNYDEAINSIKWILSDDNGINDADVHMEVYDLLSRYSELGGDSRMADFYRMKYYEAKDSLMRDLVVIEPTRLGIEIDNIQEKAREKEEERQRISLWLIFAISLVVILSVVSILIYRKNRALKLKNKVIFNQIQSNIQSQPPKAGPPTPDEGHSYDAKEESPEKAIETEKTEKYRDSSLTDETRRDLIRKIEEVMGNMDEICDSNFSLQKLTSIIGSNTSYISRAVNEHYGISFGNLLNRYRIQEACRRMGDTKNYGNLTIEAISKSVGFNTRATFVKAFRLNIGMLPSEYARLLKTEGQIQQTAANFSDGE